MSKEELLRKLKVIKDANEMLMIDQYGQPVCKSCMMQESLSELIKEAEDE